MVHIKKKKKKKKTTLNKQKTKIGSQSLCASFSW